MFSEEPEALRSRRQATSARPGPSYTSALPELPERFLAELLENGLRRHILEADAFVEAIPPRVLVHALAREPRKRAAILEVLLGLPRRRALSVSTGLCAIKLEQAFREGEFDAEMYTQILSPDDRVRLLDHGDLWRWVTRGWFEGATVTCTAVQTRIVFMLEQAERSGVLQTDGLVDRLGAALLAEYLPTEELVRIFAASFARARVRDRGVRSSSALDLWAVAKFIPPLVLWRRVFAPILGFDAPRDGVELPDDELGRSWLDLSSTRGDPSPLPSALPRDWTSPVVIDVAVGERRTPMTSIPTRPRPPAVPPRGLPREGIRSQAAGSADG